MEQFKIIAFTHKTTGIDGLSPLHVQDDVLESRLHALKNSCGLHELMYLSTCNRVEFLIVSPEIPNTAFLSRFFSLFNPAWTIAEINWAIEHATVLEGEEAVKHLFNVASSLDSLVVGEREIITQVRNAYDKCKAIGLTGDFIRLVVKQTIETAKRVYTETNIARNPVSVVSLAYRKLRELNVSLDARFIFVGAGVTNTNMAKYLKKHGFSNFTVFNRTLSNAQKLATDLSAQALPLSDILQYKNGFDVMVTCTGATESVITKSIYKSLVGNDQSKKIVIDLSVPNDLDPEVLESYDINLIAVNNLQEIAKSNLTEREKELNNCSSIIEDNLSDFHQILRTRKVERAMSEIPRKVKEIHNTAITEVFAREIENMDQQSRDVLNKILSYVEKKYISVPMKLAKEILIDNN